MTINCPHCKQAYEVEADKAAIAQPPGIECQKTARALRLSWWAHGLPFDLRWLGYAGGVLALLVTYNSLPATASVLNGEPAACVISFLVLTFSAVVLGNILRVLLRRHHLEVDSVSIRCWSEPLGSTSEANSRHVQQLYVTPTGELRAVLGPSRHQTLASGAPAAMRFAEQEIEQRLSLADVTTEGEWRAPDWILPEWRQCPHCKKHLPQAEVSRQLEPLTIPPGVHQVADAPGQVTYQWSWRGSDLLFLTLWLLVWDTICLGFVAAGIAAVSRGDLRGLGVFLVPHVWIGVGVTYYYACRLLNQTRVRVKETGFSIQHGPMPWKGGGDFRRADLQQLYVVEHRGKRTTYSLEAQTSTGQTLKLLRGEPEGRLRFLEQEIEARLGIVNTR